MRPTGKRPASKQHQKLREIVAYHEAGHAVIALHLGRPCRVVTIGPNVSAGSLGHVTHYVRKSFRPDIHGISDTRTRMAAEREIMIALGGPVAELHWTNAKRSLGDGSDMRYVVDIAMYMSADEEEAGKLCEWLKVRTRNIVSHRHIWPQVEALASALITREKMSGREAENICRETKIALFPKHPTAASVQLLPEEPPR